MRDEYTVEKEEYRGYTVKLIQDTDAMNPRTEWDNLGKMICFHRRYDLGDKHDLKSGDFSGWQEIYSYLRKECGAEIILPLYLYDHSGITMSCSRTYPYNDVWDAGQVGFIYMTKEQIIKELGRPKPTEKNPHAFGKIKHIMKCDREHALKYLEGEVQTYDDYLTGNVVGFEVEDDDGEVVESCWGFYGDEGREEAMSEAKAIVDTLADERDTYNAVQAVGMC